jgi:MYXO-CTERM domain-containing protein
VTWAGTSRGVGVTLAVTLVSLRASTALACSGPCDVGDVWSAAWVGDELNVVTNFGLLRRGEAGWHLDCEEVLGDKVTGAHYSESVQVTLTASGFLVRQDGICNWESQIEGASNSWLLGSGLAQLADDDSGVSAPTLLGLVIDRSTSDTKVEAAPLGGAFRTLATFSWELGLDRMVVGGDPVRIYTAGYSFPPRTWHVRSARLDVALGGDVDEVEFEATDLEREGELAEMRPLAVDPRTSEHLWVRSAVTTQDPDELWLFDASSGTLDKVFTLERKEKLADLAFHGERMFVAGRDEGVSVVYAASLEELHFEPIATLDATLTCLEIDDGGWLVCNSDFTRQSPFIVATSDDEGQSWQPQLQLEDLTTLTSCGEICAATTGWLFGVYGTLQGDPTTSGVRDFDSGALQGRGDGSAAASHEGDARRKPAGDPPSGCGCRVQDTSAPHSLLLGLAFLAGLLRRRRASTGNAGALHWPK